jgi:hypothetical protein
MHEVVVAALYELTWVHWWFTLAATTTNLWSCICGNGTRNPHQEESVAYWKLGDITQMHAWHDLHLTCTCLTLGVLVSGF